MPDKDRRLSQRQKKETVTKAEKGKWQKTIRKIEKGQKAEK